MSIVKTRFGKTCPTCKEGFFLKGQDLPVECPGCGYRMHANARCYISTLTWTITMDTRIDEELTTHVCKPCFDKSERHWKQLTDLFPNAVFMQAEYKTWLEDQPNTGRWGDDNSNLFGRYYVDESNFTAAIRNVLDAVHGSGPRINWRVTLGKADDGAFTNLESKEISIPNLFEHKAAIGRSHQQVLDVMIGDALHEAGHCAYDKAKTMEALAKWASKNREDAWAVTKCLNLVADYNLEKKVLDRYPKFRHYFDRANVWNCEHSLPALIQALKVEGAEDRMVPRIGVAIWELLSPGELQRQAGDDIITPRLRWISNQAYQVLRTAYAKGQLNTEEGKTKVAKAIYFLFKLVSPPGSPPPIGENKNGTNQQGDKSGTPDPDEHGTGNSQAPVEHGDDSERSEGSGGEASPSDPVSNGQEDAVGDDRVDNQHDDSATDGDDPEGGEEVDDRPDEGPAGEDDGAESGVGDDQSGDRGAEEGRGIGTVQDAEAEDTEEGALDDADDDDGHGEDAEPVPGGASSGDGDDDQVDEGATPGEGEDDASEPLQEGAPRHDADDHRSGEPSDRGGDEDDSEDAAASDHGDSGRSSDRTEQVDDKAGISAGQEGRLDPFEDGPTKGDTKASDVEKWAKQGAEPIAPWGAKDEDYAYRDQAKKEDLQDTVKKTAEEAKGLSYTLVPVPEPSWWALPQLKEKAAKRAREVAGTVAEMKRVLRLRNTDQGGQLRGRHSGMLTRRHVTRLAAMHRTDVFHKPQPNNLPKVRLGILVDESLSTGYGMTILPNGSAAMYPHGGMDWTDPNTGITHNLPAVPKPLEVAKDTTSILTLALEGIKGVKLWVTGYSAGNPDTAAAKQIRLRHYGAPGKHVSRELAEQDILNGSTPTGEAMTEMAQALLKGAMPDEKLVCLVITDGESNANGMSTHTPIRTHWGRITFIHVGLGPVKDDAFAHYVGPVLNPGDLPGLIKDTVLELLS